VRQSTVQSPGTSVVKASLSCDVPALSQTRLLHCWSSSGPDPYDDGRSRKGKPRVLVCHRTGALEVVRSVPPPFLEVRPS